MPYEAITHHYTVMVLELTETGFPASRYTPRTFADRDAALADAITVARSYGFDVDGYESPDDALQALNEDVTGLVLIDVLPTLVAA